MAPSLKSHSALRQEEPLQCHAALLRNEVFNVILGTVNMQHGTASWAGKGKGGRTTSEYEVFNSCYLPHISDTPIAGSGNGHRVTFRSLVTRSGVSVINTLFGPSACTLQPV